MRHSEPALVDHDKLGLIGFGKDLAPLTQRGIALAGEAAKNPMLEGADLILSSPLTRALQTAGIVARHTGNLIEADFGLVERRIDLKQALGFEESKHLWEEYKKCRGEWPENEERNWENISMQHERLRDTLSKYLRCNKIIVIAHGELGRRFLAKSLDFCGMFEIEYTDKFEFLPWNE